MDLRAPLLKLLADYRPEDAADAATRDRFAAFVAGRPDCFERGLAIGHVTAAGWLLDPAGRRVLLTHHRKLDKWLQPGGHCDGDPDVHRVALREAREESGLHDIRLRMPAIFDLDIHPIPARDGEPAHAHYDVRFLVQSVSGDSFIVSDESHALRWFTSDEFAAPADSTGGRAWDESILRMHRKWLKMHAVREHYAACR